MPFNQPSHLYELLTAYNPCHNGLSLNADISDVVLLGTSRRKTSYNNLPSIDVAGSMVSRNSTIKLLGVMLDENLSLDSCCRGVQIILVSSASNETH